MYGWGCDCVSVMCVRVCVCVFMHEYVEVMGEEVAEKEVTSYLFSSELAPGR